MIFCGAFSKNIRLEIKRRSKNRSELSGLVNGSLVCGHLNHDKRSPEYNSPNNGLRVTVFEELGYHLMHTRNPESIGLSRKVNDSVVRGHIGKLLEDYTMDEIRNNTGEAIEVWEGYLKLDNWGNEKEENSQPVVEFQGFVD